MNRQVGPSIVFSVLIVCFFAVALFQRDPPRSARARSGLGETEKSPRTASVTEDVQGKRSTATDELRQQRPAAAARPLVTGSEDVSIARVQPASARAHGAMEAAPIVTAGLTTEAPVEPGREPARAFIVVQANETIRDVSLRVYGSSAHAAALWRANRDALPVLDSPLSPGMLLRTPSVR
jgi:nucleoid-associated protein YgaU